MATELSRPYVIYARMRIYTSGGICATIYRLVGIRVSIRVEVRVRIAGNLISVHHRNHTVPCPKTVRSMVSIEQWPPKASGSIYAHAHRHLVYSVAYEYIHVCVQIVSSFDWRSHNPKTFLATPMPACPRRLCDGIFIFVLDIGP